MPSERNYRRVGLDTIIANVVTVGIESRDGQTLAAVWWDSKPGVGSDEQQYANVEEAFSAAAAARNLHDFDDIVVILQSDDLWDTRWGQLGSINPEPVGEFKDTGLSSAEAYELAAGIEADNDA